MQKNSFLFWEKIGSDKLESHYEEWKNIDKHCPEVAFNDRVYRRYRTNEVQSNGPYVCSTHYFAPISHTKLPEHFITGCFQQSDGKFLFHSPYKL